MRRISGPQAARERRSDHRAALELRDRIAPALRTHRIPASPDGRVAPEETSPPAPTLPIAIDPERLARAIHLRAVPFNTPGLYAIEGGSRPHAVDISNRTLPICNCEDRIKGFCKHILAALIAEGDPTVTAAARALVAADAGGAA
jgi:hypothetical protein